MIAVSYISFADIGCSEFFCICKMIMLVVLEAGHSSLSLKLTDCGICIGVMCVEALIPIGSI